SGVRHKYWWPVLIDPLSRQSKILPEYWSITRPIRLLFVHARALEKMKSVVNLRRKKDPLAALCVPDPGNEFAERHPIGAQKVRGFVRTTKRRRGGDDQCAENERQDRVDRGRMRVKPGCAL